MSYLKKIAPYADNIEAYTADDLVCETSKLMGRIMDFAKTDSLEQAVTQFYILAAFAQPIYLLKNTAPNSIAEANDYADAHEYYMDTLKEASTVIMAMLSERFGNLIPSDAVQKIATFASEEKNLTKKKIEKHISSMLPVPRKKTTDKRGGKR